ncbi:DUF3606 domain-containing protein [Pedobacter sp. HMF7647]|uniref:DUF3606 domain-containing protein n=1 Tax=Hufsiella arboris TaxID=2695275 RepID=A0A7K1Y8L5_9SPHI|nr:DUF3606 domain-containing protein [Hufsiella arboris]MXV50419.1 DUF3606 domain-containing protein [Hufsiella arboris]
MDDKKTVGSPDRDRVNVNEDYEVQYWTEKFGVSADELKAAVKAAGTSATAVEAYLKKK